MATKGSTALSKVLRPTITRRELAERLGVSQQAVSNWLCGVAVPSARHMAAIEELTGVPMRDWLEAVADATDDDAA